MSGGEGQASEGTPPSRVPKDGEYPRRTTPRNVIRIDFEMMIKGSVYDRPGGRVKQYGVTVDGATKVITSGDLVDQATYNALLKAGAIRPTPKPSGDEPPAGRPPQKQRRAG